MGSIVKSVVWGFEHLWILMLVVVVGCVVVLLAIEGKIAIPQTLQSIIRK